MEAVECKDMICAWIFGLGVWIGGWTYGMMYIPSCSTNECLCVFCFGLGDSTSNSIVYAQKLTFRYEQLMSYYSLEEIVFFSFVKIYLYTTMLINFFIRHALAHIFILHTRCISLLCMHFYFPSSTARSVIWSTVQSTSGHGMVML